MARNQQNNVSIRLMSGGHSFSKRDIEAIKQAGDGVVVEVVTPKTVLRPADGFIPADAIRDLEDTGYVLSSNEVVACSAEVNGRVAVFAMCRECAEAIAMLGVAYSYTSPLVVGDDMTDGTYMALYGDVLYVRVYRDGLRLAEAIAVASDADIVYYLESIHRVYNIYNISVVMAGDVERLGRVCKKYTKIRI